MTAAILLMAILLAPAQSLPARFTLPKDASLGDASGAAFKVTPPTETGGSSAYLAVDRGTGVVCQVWVQEHAIADELRGFGKGVADPKFLSQSGDVRMRPGTFSGKALGDASYVFSLYGKDLPDRIQVRRGKFRVEGMLQRKRSAINLVFERSDSLYLEKLVRATVKSLDRVIKPGGGAE